MASFGVIQQGNFVGTGSAVNLNIRSDVDWIRVYNVTVATNDQTTAEPVEWYWQRGFPAGAMWTYFKSSAANAANLSEYTLTGGFTLIDTTRNPLGPLVSTITAISGANPPVASNTGTNGLSANQVVRFYNTVGAQQLAGMDFTVGNRTLTTTTFSLDYMAVIAAGTTGAWRVVNWELPYYPRFRYITKITSSGSQSIITLSVTHGYTVGQKIQINVPASYGMIQMNGLEATIVAITTEASGTSNTITVNIDSSAFTAFVFPTTANADTVRATIVPVGENSAYAQANGLDPLADATKNLSFIGIQLGAGPAGPAGSASDVIYWVAGKSFSVTNTVPGTF